MKVYIISGVVIVILSMLAFLFFNKSQTNQIPESLIHTSAPTQMEKVDIKASFTIITGSITRSFKAEKYHNQSKDVYITSDDSTIIHVNKKGITYDDFFKTLPMKLTKDCLITGDGETLCSGKGGILKFFLNDIETPDLLNKQIMMGDKVYIQFTPS